MNRYQQERRTILASLDNEEDEAADTPTSPLPDEPGDVIHVYPTEDGGVVLLPTELEPGERFTLERQERPTREGVTFFLFAAYVFLLLGLIVFALFLPPPNHAVSFTVSVPSVPLPSVTKGGETVKARATGVKTLPATTAQGRLTITNGSAIAQQLPAGMIFVGTREVVTDAPVFVPAGSANGYGVATVLAHALVSGASGNIAAYAINMVEGSSIYIRNLEPFTGGRDAQTFTYLTAQDVKRAASSLEPRLQAQTLALFPSPVVLNPTCTTTARSQPQVGQTTPSAVVTVSETCRAITYRLSAVRTAITAYSQQVLGAGTLSNVQSQIVGVKGGTIALYVTATWNPMMVRPYPARR